MLDVESIELLDGVPVAEGLVVEEPLVPVIVPYCAPLAEVDGDEPDVVVVG